jgi:hypothetical protein
MKIWEPNEGVEKRDMPIVMIPGASVDEKIFSLPTIPTNTVDYFTSLGSDYQSHMLIPSLRDIVRLSRAQKTYLLLSQNLMTISFTPRSNSRH